MKIYSGKSYITADGSSTGLLKMNPHRSITYPYHSESLKMEFKEDGTPCDNYKGFQIVGVEYAATLIVDQANGDVLSEIERLKEENEAMRMVLKQNIQAFLKLKQITKAYEHKLPRELREYLNQ